MNQPLLSRPIKSSQFGEICKKKKQLDNRKSTIQLLNVRGLTENRLKLNKQSTNQS